MKPKIKIWRIFPLDGTPIVSSGFAPYTPPPVDGTSGMFLSTNGAGILSWAFPAGGKSLYFAVVGSAAQVATGIATHFDLQTAINDTPSGREIFVLSGTYTGTFTLNKQIAILGEGRGCNINGTFTIQSGSDYSILKFVRFADNVVIDATAVGNIVTDFWIANGKTVTDNSLDILVLGMEE